MPTSSAEDLFELAMRLSPPDRLQLVERIAHDLSPSRSRAEESEPSGEARFTVADLFALLEVAPRPDDMFLDELEAVSQDQPQVPPAPWRR